MNLGATSSIPPLFNTLLLLLSPDGCDHTHNRGLSVPGYEKGNFLGPTVLGGSIGPGIPGYDEEVFGPVLCCITVETLEEAIELVNACQYGNGSYKAVWRASILPSKKAHLPSL